MWDTCGSCTSTFFDYFCCQILCFYFSKIQLSTVDDMSLKVGIWWRPIYISRNVFTKHVQKMGDLKNSEPITKKTICELFVGNTHALSNFDSSALVELYLSESATSDTIFGTRCRAKWSEIFEHHNWELLRIDQSTHLSIDCWIFGVPQFTISIFDLHPVQWVINLVLDSLI